MNLGNENAENKKILGRLPRPDSQEKPFQVGDQHRLPPTVPNKGGRTLKLSKNPESNIVILNEVK